MIEHEIRPSRNTHARDASRTFDHISRAGTKARGILSFRSVPTSAQQAAFVVSLALHSALGVWVEVRADERAPSAKSEPLRDAWAGNGIEVDAPTDAPAAPVPAVTPNETAAAVAAPKRAVARRTVAAPAQRTEPPSRDASERDAPRSDEAAARAAAAPSNGSPAPFGAAGLPPGVRHLPRAFTRAVALANRGDAAWRTLPAGVVGEASVALPVEDSGALGSLSFDDARERDRLLPAVRRMLDNTVLLLASGRFSLNARELSGGVMRVRVRVEILEQSALAAPDVDPNELNAIDYEPPQAGKAGHGAFLLNSGRRVICWVTPIG
jgi:hypothetical protein